MRTDEFGDFQTPDLLAVQIVRMLRQRGIDPASVLEPTVGRGSLLAAALREFPRCERAAGFDIQPGHVRAARLRLRALGAATRVELRVANVFELDLEQELRALPAPSLIIGNPPWVTNARLGALGASNLPRKSNFHKRTGLDALTGKANFDISEWIILKLLEALAAAGGVLTMLCKTKVARRVLSHCAEQRLPIGKAALYGIDARLHFGAAVDACVLVCERTRARASLSCGWHPNLASRRAQDALLFTQGLSVAHGRAFRNTRELLGPGGLCWRSGIKHDCASVLELLCRDGRMHNADGEQVELEHEHLFPLMKGSDLTRSGDHVEQRMLLLPQRHTGEDPARRLRGSPGAWRYLTEHQEAFRRRASTVYRNRPAFSVFGVGDYSLSRWKVAVPAMHKTLVVALVGPRDGKPVVFDDTCYFVACRDELHARLLHALVTHPRAQEFFRSMIFWADKRPITRQLLGSINLAVVARQEGDAILRAFESRGLDRARLLPAWERLIADCEPAA